MVKKSFCYILTVLLVINCIFNIFITDAKAYTDKESGIDINVTTEEEGIKVEVDNTSENMYKNFDVEVKFPDDNIETKDKLSIKEDILEENEKVVRNYNVKFINKSNNSILYILVGAIIVILLVVLIILNRRKKIKIISALIIGFTLCNFSYVYAADNNIVKKEYEDYLYVNSEKIKYAVEFSYESCEDEEYKITNENKDKLILLIKGLYNLSQYSDGKASTIFLDTATENGLPANDETALSLMFFLASESYEISNKEVKEKKIEYSVDEIKSILTNSMDISINNTQFDYYGWQYDGNNIKFSFIEEGDLKDKIEIKSAKQLDNDTVIITGTCLKTSEESSIGEKNFILTAQINPDSIFGGLKVIKFEI